MTVYRQLAISLPEVNFIFMNLLEQTTVSSTSGKTECKGNCVERSIFQTFIYLFLFQTPPCCGIISFSFCDVSRCCIIMNEKIFVEEFRLFCSGWV